MSGSHLLEMLFDARNKILIEEWHKDKATQDRVMSEIIKILNSTLPDSYDRQIFSEKSKTIYQHFYQLAEMGLRLEAVYL